MRNKTILVVPLVLAFASITLPSRKSSAEVAASLQAAIHLKVLSFDRSLKAKPGKSLTIGVVVPSLGASTGIVQAFSALASEKRVRVHGKSLRVVEIIYGDSFASALRSKGVDVLYVAPQLSSTTSRISGTTSALSIPTMCGNRGQAELGISVAVINKGGKPSIVINPKAAQAAGMKLDAKLLRLAEIIK